MTQSHLGGGGLFLGGGGELGFGGGGGDLKHMVLTREQAKQGTNAEFEIAMEYSFGS
jgi:hypothetical protein